MSEGNSIHLSLVYERIASSHPWLDWEWSVCGMMPVADSDIDLPPRLLERSETMTRWLGEPSRLDLHRTDLDAYVYNLTSPQPSVYTVAHELDEIGRAHV